MAASNHRLNCTLNGGACVPDASQPYIKAESTPTGLLCTGITMGWMGREVIRL